MNLEYLKGYQIRDNDPNRNRPLEPNEALFHPNETKFMAAHFPGGMPDEEEFELKSHELYSWTRSLPPDLKLPDGELLEDIHTYASDFFGAHPEMSKMFRSMDETALVALAVLMEELMSEALGTDGDLALLEAKGEDVGAIPKYWNGWRMAPIHTEKKYVSTQLPDSHAHVMKVSEETSCRT